MNWLKWTHRLAQCLLFAAAVAAAVALGPHWALALCIPWFGAALVLESAYDDLRWNKLWWGVYFVTDAHRARAAEWQFKHMLDTNRSRVARPVSDLTPSYSDDEPPLL